MHKYVDKLRFWIWWPYAFGGALFVSQLLLPALRCSRRPKGEQGRRINLKVAVERTAPTALK